MGKYAQHVKDGFLSLRECAPESFGVQNSHCFCTGREGPGFGSSSMKLGSCMGRRWCVFFPNRVRLKAGRKCAQARVTLCLACLFPQHCRVLPPPREAWWLWAWKQSQFCLPGPPGLSRLCVHGCAGWWWAQDIFQGWAATYFKTRYCQQRGGGRCWMGQLVAKWNLYSKRWCGLQDQAAVLNDSW
jgi:hypothetical protein